MIHSQNLMILKNTNDIWINSNYLTYNAKMQRLAEINMFFWISKIPTKSALIYSINSYGSYNYNRPNMLFVYFSLCYENCEHTFVFLSKMQWINGFRDTKRHTHIFFIKVWKILIGKLYDFHSWITLTFAPHIYVIEFGGYSASVLLRQEGSFCIHM